jgi:hypothetical protein
MDDKYFKLTIHTCSGCGYFTSNKSNMNAHIKSAAKCVGSECITTVENVMREKDVVNMINNTNNDVVRKEQKRKPSEPQKRVREFEDLLDPTYEPEIEDERQSGLVYYVVDKDLPTRAKFGRTKNTDVKMLKARYSIFGNPLIMCTFSEDIRNDEMRIKSAMQEAGHINLERGKESVVHCEDAARVFAHIVSTSDAMSTVTSF